VPASAARLTPAQAESQLLQEQAQLADALENSGVSLLRSGLQLRLIVPVWQLFSADALELKAGAIGIAPLPQLVAVLQAHPSAQLQIRVFTDSIGGAVVNQTLSLRRGQALGAAFDEAGIDPARLQVFAVGESSPVASNDTPEGRRQNRRIELTLLPG
jgi:outer membrane protein OmpA-like peptidoglycan-associated protein